MNVVVLVARREFRSRVWSKPVLGCSVLVAVLLVTFLFLQAFVFGSEHPIRIGLAGQAIGLAEGLPQETASLGLTVAVSQVDSVADGVAQVKAGELDVLVSGARAALHVTVDNQLDPQLRTTLNGLVRQQVLDAQIAQLGARPQDVLSRVDQAQISLTQLNVTDPERVQRVAIGVVVGLLVTLALAGAAALATAAAVAGRRDGTEEVVLTVLRPRRLLLANLAGPGVTGLVHLVAVGVLGVVVALATGVVTLPGSLLAGFGTGLLWYVLGVAVVGTICTTRRTAMWLLAGLIVVFVLSTILLTADPGGTATAVLSVLPPFAPVLLPGRLVVGVASAWQVPLAVGLTLVLLAGLTAKRISLP
ncbi:MAG TPA: ABC transporter permease [Pseudonocardiaceae bacterium]|jgi:ABC-2 type transport system permease protein|nr:ABC transporter permease [Pseudonocardiaceae bacterium]